MSERRESQTQSLTYAPELTADLPKNRAIKELFHAAGGTKTRVAVL